MSAPMENEEDSDFSCSKLGTKQYWDEAYNLELENYKENGEEGEVWFGLGSVKRVVTWMKASGAITENSSVLDLGCGNGLSLIHLHKQGFRDLTGVDYVQAAVDLAKAVAEEYDANITYEQGDILEDEMSSKCLQRQYEICHDKGTYDAICLNPDDPKGKRNRYYSNVRKLLKSGDFFIITSCNWTEDELKSHFESEGFIFLDRIPAPMFQFGGQVGSRETSLVFKRKTDDPS